MAYLPGKKPPRPAYTATPGWGSMNSRGTLSRPKPLAKPRLKRDEPSLRRVDTN